MKDNLFDELAGILSGGTKVLETSDALEVTYPEKGFGVRLSHSTMVVYSLLDEGVYYATAPKVALLQRYLQYPPQWAVDAPVTTKSSVTRSTVPKSTVSPTSIIRDCVHKGTPKADCLAILKEKCADRSEKSLKTLIHSLYSTEGKKLRKQ